MFGTDGVQSDKRWTVNKHSFSLTPQLKSVL
jgi:hypothetical protein